MAIKFRLPVAFTRFYFRVTGRPFKVRLGTIEIGDAAPREFDSKALGWHLSNRVRIKVGTEEVVCQVTLNVIVLGSKDLPAGQAPRPTGTTP